MTKTQPMIKQVVAMLKKNRLFAFAVLVSILVHLAIFNSWPFNKRDKKDERKLLEVRLTKLQPSLQTAIKHTETDRPSLVQSDTTLHKKKKKVSLAKSSPIKITSEPNLDKSATNLPAAIEQHNQENNNAVPALIYTNESTTLSQPSAHPLTGTFDFIEAEYETYYITSNSSVTDGNSGHLITTSKVTINFQEESQTYSLVSINQDQGGMQTTILTSEGRVTPFGLKPEYFLHKIEGDESSAKQIDFYWADGIAEIQSANGKKAEKLSEGSIDELSYQYHFMFSHSRSSMQANNNIELPHLAEIPSNSLLNIRDFVFVGEENVLTQFGEIKTIHLTKDNNADKVNIELWLAIDFNYLPIKIRKTDINGHLTEQIVTKISAQDKQINPN